MNHTRKKRPTMWIRKAVFDINLVIYIGYRNDRFSPKSLYFEVYATVSTLIFRAWANFGGINIKSAKVAAKGRCKLLLGIPKIDLFTDRRRKGDISLSSPPLALASPFAMCLRVVLSGYSPNRWLARRIEMLQFSSLWKMIGLSQFKSRSFHV